MAGSAQFSGAFKGFASMGAIGKALAARIPMASLAPVEKTPADIYRLIQRATKKGYSPDHNKKGFARPFSAQELKVERLTNWQRTQWARAGYKPERLDEFAQLERRR